MPNPATRLITLIMLLQRKPNQKAHELAEQLGVSVRTVQRYILMLDDMGIPVYAERGPYGGYALVRGYKMPPLVLTPEEAVRVLLGAPRMPLPEGEISGAVENAGAGLRFEVRGSDPCWSVLEFDARELLSRYQVVGPEGTIFQVRYDDYLVVAGARFAHRVELDFPILEVHAEVRFRGVELNPVLPESIFRLQLPERVFSPPEGPSG